MRCAWAAIAHKQERLITATPARIAHDVRELIASAVATVVALAVDPVRCIKLVLGALAARAVDGVRDSGGWGAASVHGGSRHAPRTRLASAQGAESLHLHPPREALRMEGVLAAVEGRARLGRDA